MDFEPILYVPLKAWERLHNKTIEQYPHETKSKLYETYSNKKWMGK